MFLYEYFAYKLKEHWKARWIYLTLIVYNDLEQGTIKGSPQEEAWVDLGSHPAYCIALPLEAFLSRDSIIPASTFDKSVWNALELFCSHY